MKFFVYILQSNKTNRFYIGQTQNLEKRIKRHNAGYEKSTRPYAPWELLYSKEFESRSKAFQFEKKLKSKKKRTQIENIISNSK